MSRRTYYMHTLNGKPAGFSKKRGALFFVGDKQEVTTGEMATSLSELRKQQRAHDDWYFTNVGPHLQYLEELGYIRSAERGTRGCAATSTSGGLL